MLEKAVEIDQAIGDEALNCDSKKRRNNFKRNIRESTSLRTNCVRGNRRDRMPQAFSLGDRRGSGPSLT